ncbi:DUF882 domain-containing protein [Neorhizobium sp. P12A]|uniref:DUF882 domain-containing protein n=1 Tax=Neorhizobium sp. P12A TaxID=2268027 RepID=UPI0011EC52ED|nr:DUF882 domain-containing protein [Neorhizobium sp. P12A]KAA0700963.1 DUF882 domain-containing protein [Neorhizobium sp. P12A]
MPSLNGNTKREGLSIFSVCSAISRKVAKAVAVVLLAAAVSTPVFVSTPTQATGDTRSLKIYYVHTGEKAVITYKRNGKFDPRGLEQLNRILRDWRKNQPTKMNPRLFDLIWEVYRESGSHEFIYVICGFRSPETNEMLRTRTSHTGVAKKSQHMLGNAMDFYIPDVKLSKLREIGMKQQEGGVGFYPTSGSPFVHMDVGGVRAWPRMDRQDLVRLFPDGKTMHIPADGKPLPGYQEAVADYKRRLAGEDIQMASASPKHRGFFAMLFGGGGADEDEDNSDTESDTATPDKAAPVAVASNQAQSDDDDSGAPAAAAPAAAQVASVNAPIPQVRPAFGDAPGGSEVASALVSPSQGNAAQDALNAALPANGQQQSADLSAYNVPVPSLLENRRSPGDAGVASGDPEIASVDPDMSGERLTGVPVPAERPAVAENLLASTDADPDAQDDAADEGTLSPAVVAALEQRRADENLQNTVSAPAVPVNTAPAVASNPAPTVASNSVPVPVPPPGQMPVNALQAINAAMPKKVPTPRPPVQMAALAPVSVSGTARFGDAFEVQPQSSALQGNPIAAGLPVKGGRPGKQDADVASASHAAVRTEPKLTEKMISQWALTNSRLEVSNRPVKAPRFVSQTLRAQPVAVYTQGFKVQTASIDPGRFSGTAVNFLEVKKFNSVQ